jgi:pSer/pThr/pTyr-binding forkhead associated (FHA) protein
VPAEYVIGQDPDCHIRVQDPYVSGHHAVVIVHSAAVCLLADLGSTNGTWLRRADEAGFGQVVGQVPLLPGDVIRVGHTEIPWKLP